MIDHPSFSTEQRAIRETDLDLDVLAQTEALFALGNGHLGLRGNLDEGEPRGLMARRRATPSPRVGHGPSGTGTMR